MRGAWGGAASHIHLGMMAGHSEGGLHICQHGNCHQTPVFKQASLFGQLDVPALTHVTYHKLFNSLFNKMFHPNVPMLLMSI